MIRATDINIKINRTFYVQFEVLLNVTEDVHLLRLPLFPIFFHGKANIWKKKHSELKSLLSAKGKKKLFTVQKDEDPMNRMKIYFQHYSQGGLRI